MAPNERNKSDIFKYHFSGTMENIVLSLLMKLWNYDLWNNIIIFFKIKWFVNECRNKIISYRISINFNIL